MMFVVLRAVISSLSCIIRLDFITEKECVYSALRIEYFILYCNNVSPTAATAPPPPLERNHMAREANIQNSV
jgi:hypothetical protein